MATGCEIMAKQFVPFVFFFYFQFFLFLAPLSLGSLFDVGEYSFKPLFVSGIAEFDGFMMQHKNTLLDFKFAKGANLDDDDVGK